MPKKTSMNVTPCLKNGVKGWKYKDGVCHIGIEGKQRALREAMLDKQDTKQE